MQAYDLYMLSDIRWRNVDLPWIMCIPFSSKFIVELGGYVEMVEYDQHHATTPTSLPWPGKTSKIGNDVGVVDIGRIPPFSRNLFCLEQIFIIVGSIERKNKEVEEPTVRVIQVEIVPWERESKHYTYIYVHTYSELYIHAILFF